MALVQTRSYNGRNGKQPFPGTVPDKLQPHNIEAEEALLGAILVDPDAIIKVAHLGITAADFFVERHGWIWEAAHTLDQDNTPVNFVSVVDTLTRAGRLKEVGGSAYLTGLINQTPSSLWAEHYARIVHRSSVLRQLITASGQIARLAFADNVEADEAIEQATNILLDVTKRNVRQNTRDLGELGDRFLDKLNLLKASPNGVTGFPTGLIDLDKLLGGLQRGDLIILAGRPSMGKSALALQIALEGAKKYKARSLIFSREMSDDSLFQRMIAYESGIDVQRLRTGQIRDDEYSSLFETTERLSALSSIIAIDDFTATPEAIRAKAIIENEKHGLDLVVVDYIQRVDPPSSRNYQNKVAEVGAVSSMLKSLALDLDIPVLAISSLSRNCENRHDKRPQLSDLRESGDLEYDADEVLFMYRDEVYNPDTIYPNVAEINIAKQRQGPLGLMSVFFKKNLTKFIDLEVHKEPLDWVK